LTSFRTVPSSAYPQLAYAVVETDDDDENIDVNLAKATELMKIASNEAVKNKTHLKPVYMNEREWEYKRNQDYIRVLEANAEVYLWAKNYEAALAILEKAEAACMNEIPGTIYALYIDFYSSTSNAEQALETATKAIKNSQSSKSIEDYHKILFDSLRPGSDYEPFISNIKKIARNKRIQKLMHKKLNMNADLGVIKSVSGKALDLDRQQGRVVIIEFWSTWCGPCREAMSAFDRLAGKYALRSDIVFAAVAVWEKGENVSEAVNDFLTDAEFKVPTYLDEKSELPKNVGLTGLPARIYIGKNGKVQFIESGFTDEYSFKRDSEDKIELLSK
jgi:thiol-disulfide isomerase/thioredoxin